MSVLNSFLLLLCVSMVKCQLDIKLVNNGYENVIVAISDTISYDSDLIPRIKVWFYSVDGFQIVL